MAGGLSPWRALRPVLLAGAATLTWLTLSSTAAAADSAESGSLLGGVTSSVSSLAAPLASTLPTVPDFAPPAPQSAPPAGLLQPVLGTLTGSTDELVAAVPVVGGVVPAGTVSAVTGPVAGVADDATTGLLETVAPPLIEAIPALGPAVEPVTDLVTGALPLPVALPSVPDSGSVITDSAGLLDDGDSLGHPAATGKTAATIVGQFLWASSTGSAGLPASPVALAGTSASPGGPGPALPLADSPSPAPSGPSSGAGSGASPSGPSGSAAWLNDLDLDLLLPGSFPVSGPSEQAPSPVSFDPGSSPD